MWPSVPSEAASVARRVFAMGVLGWIRAAILTAIAAAAICVVLFYAGFPALQPRAGAITPAKAATTQQAADPAPRRPPVVVATARVERRDMPVRLDAIGTVQTLSSVTVRSRVDTQIIKVGFRDGGHVRQGDLLFELDSRHVETQIRQAEAGVARDRASLVAAETDQRRAEDLARLNVGSGQKLDAARTSVSTLKASIRGGEATVEGLKIQLTYYTITAPISGRIGVASLKEGNIVNTREGSPALATINQFDPIYVAFALPQRHLAAVRASMAAGTAMAQVTPHGANTSVQGRIAMIDNLVDATTGTIQMRAVFDNPGETLWPGALCQMRLTLRVQPGALTVPREAIQTGQDGSFVFIISDGVARPRPVTIDRTIDDRVVLAAGLKEDETVVTDGQLLLTDGAPVIERSRERAPPPNLTSQRGGAG